MDPGGLGAQLSTGPSRVTHRRVPLPRWVEPVQAASALLDRGAVLLESRTQHPEARRSVVAFGPTRRLVAFADGEGDAPDGWEAVTLDALLHELDDAADLGSDAGPGPGWYGVLTHEAGAALVGEPYDGRGPLAWFTHCAHALTFDARRRTATLITASPDLDAAALASELEAAAPPADWEPVQGEATPDMDQAAYEAAVARVQRLVRDGDCFQVNLTTALRYRLGRAPDARQLLGLYRAYAEANPAPFCGFLESPWGALVSASPELLFEASAGTLRLRPIAGTRPRSDDLRKDEKLARALAEDPKEQAEHAMLVDLARNDAARVCQPGSVVVPSLAGTERYRHVMHLVSQVEGRLARGAGLSAVLASVFPGGTVTGAPKRRAVRRIRETEAGPRGAYTGALGYVGGGGAQFSLLIRTLVANGTEVTAFAGCGIVEGSRPAAEWGELMDKARAQLAAVEGKTGPAPTSLDCGRVDPGPRWRPQADGSVRAVALLVDFEDSFVQNLADYARASGAEVRVASAHDPVASAWGPDVTHLVLSPGPGRPRDFPSAAEHLERARTAGIPVLGVCLGHQAMAEYLGGATVRHSEAVHGRATRLDPAPASSDDPVLGPWGGQAAGRYHSLVCKDLPADAKVLARLDDGTPMAVRYGDRPWWGLQFHPESVLTPRGWLMVRAFLEVCP